jgi:hypothetical protein
MSLSVFTVRAAAALKDGGAQRRSTIIAESDRALLEAVEKGKLAADENVEHVLSLQ